MGKCLNKPLLVATLAVLTHTKEEVSAISHMKQVEYNRLRDQVYDGLDFMMEHFEDCEELPRQRTRFPRNVATGATRRGQRTVNDSGEAMMFYKAALYEDCYLNAYTNYDVMIERGELSPTYRPLPRHVVIDIDRTSFQTDEELETAIKETLANIHESITGLSGREPTVIWSGNGYHVHIPLDGWTCPLEELPEFFNFRNYPELTNRFLRFTERELSNGKADQHHNPTIKSCLFRVPWTINSKAKAVGKDPFVRVVKGAYPILSIVDAEAHLNNNKSRPTNAFLNKFLTSLIQEVIDAKVEKLQRMRHLAHVGSSNSNNNNIFWVDRLLQTPVEDGRKNLMFWVLAPYLITVKGLDYDRAYHIIESWLGKCDNVKRLDPGWTHFRYRIRYCLDTAEDQERKPIRFDTFKEYYHEVYKELYRTGVD
jgi:hypothetical protein